MMDNIFGIAGTALNAQLTRMNATASNLANAGTVATTAEEAFRAKRPQFKTIVEGMLNKADTHNGQDIKGGVKIEQLVDDPAPVRRQFDPTTRWPTRMDTSTSRTSTRSARWWK